MDNFVVYLVVYLLAGIPFGIATKHVSASKGYDGGFAWGYWLGLIGLIVVAVRPTIRNQEVRYCQIKFATLDSVYHVTLPVYPVI